MKRYLHAALIMICFLLTDYLAFSQTGKPKKPVQKPVATKPAPTVVVSKPVQNVTVSKPATKPASPVEKISPFKKGTWNMANRTNITYTNFKLFPTGTSSSFTAVINPKYFFTDHIAVGIEARIHSDKASSQSSSFSSYYAYLNLTYGTTISKKVNIFATIAAGPGHSRSSFNNSGTPGNDKILVSKSFDINGTIGVPILLQKGGFSYFTPFVKYDKYHNEPGTHEIDEKSIGFGLKLETYFNPAAWKQNTNNKTALYAQSYKQGQSFLEYNSMSNFNSSKRNEKVGTTIYGAVKTTSFSFGAGYHYYFIDNIAGGLNIDISSTKTDNLGSSPSKDKQWTIQPTVMANVPVDNALHNLFLQAGYGFGNSNFSGLKKKLTNISVRTGYNFFFGKGLSITPKIGYERDKTVGTNGSSVGVTDIRSGFAAELGIRTWLDHLWKRK